MTPLHARLFIEQVLAAPDMAVAQMIVDTNLAALDQTFFQVLEQLIQEAQVQSRIPPGVNLHNLSGSVADAFLNQLSQGQ